MKLYHGTKLKNLEAIKEHGLLKNAGFPFLPEFKKINEGCGRVYLADDIRVAEAFNSEVVFSVNLSDLNPNLLETYEEPICRINGWNAFYNYADNIPFSLLTIEPSVKSS